MFASLRRLNLSTPGCVWYLSFWVYIVLFLSQTCMSDSWGNLHFCLKFAVFQNSGALHRVKWIMIYCLLLEIVKSRFQHASLVWFTYEISMREQYYIYWKQKYSFVRLKTRFSYTGCTFVYFKYGKILPCLSENIYYWHKFCLRRQFMQVSRQLP